MSSTIGTSDLDPLHEQAFVLDPGDCSRYGIEECRPSTAGVTRCSYLVAKPNQKDISCSQLCVRGVQRGITSSAVYCRSAASQACKLRLTHDRHPCLNLISCHMDVNLELLSHVDGSLETDIGRTSSMPFRPRAHTYLFWRQDRSPFTIALWDFGSSGSVAHPV